MDPANPQQPQHFRAFSRQVVSLAGALRGNVGGEEDIQRDVRVVDLGLGGACLETSDDLPPGTLVELIVDTPHLWDPLTLRGAIVWARPIADPEGAGALLGVRFEHQTGTSIRTLTELLEAEAFG